MRQSSRGFSPPAKMLSKSSRLSMSGLADRSVRVVMRFALTLPTNGSKAKLSPVPGGRHPRRDAGQRGGFGTQDARAKADRGGGGDGADRRGLVGGEPAFGARQQRGRAGPEGAARGGAAGFVSEVEWAIRWHGA